MTDRSAYFTNIIFIATCLAVGCTSSGTLGCGSSDGDVASEPTVDSELLGIYRLDQYQQSEQGGCNALTDVDSASSHLVLYSVPSDENPSGAALAGQFCGSDLDCRSRVKDFPTLGVDFAFLQGSDAEGWVGWALPSPLEVVGDQCVAEVQTHTLTSPTNQAIRIDTRQVETEYMPSDPAPGTNEVTCSIRDAIDSIDDASPCTKLFLLEATFEEGL
jgi:hypothetical protein